MFRKLALMWAIAVLPLAIVFFGCGGNDDDDTVPSGSGNGNDVEVPSEWNVTPQTSGVESTLQEISFFADPNNPDSCHGWVVGNDGVVLHTADKGETWEQQDSGVTGSLYTVYFVNESDGWAAGDDGTVIHTEDGGVNWERQNTGIAERLRGMFFANNTQGWAVGEGGVIIATTDGGSEWNPQTSGTNQPLEAIDFAPQGTAAVIENGWAVGGNATIVHTGDGSRWTLSRQVEGLLMSRYTVCFLPLIAKDGLLVNWGP